MRGIDDFGDDQPRWSAALVFEVGAISTIPGASRTSRFAYTFVPNLAGDRFARAPAVPGGAGCTTCPLRKTEYVRDERHPDVS